MKCRGDPRGRPDISKCPDRRIDTMATVVLAYSGGLDTSIAIRWIKEKYDLDVIALTIDVGNDRDLEAIAAKGKQIGAVKSLIVDGRAEFVNYFVWPALRAAAIYDGQY